MTNHTYGTGKDLLPRTSFNDRADQLAHYRKVDEYLEGLYGAAHQAAVAVREVEAQIKRNEKRKRLSYNQREDQQARLDAEIAELQAGLPPLKQTLAKARELARAENDRLFTGWSRFFLVQHIHKSMYCSSFRPTTRIAWLPSVSGLTEAEAVAEHGETLCTICYPSAPTSLTTKAADPDICTGVAIDRSKPHRLSTYSKWGYCATCGGRVSITSTGKVRKHRKPGR